MDRKKLEQLIFDTCSVEPDYPWMDTPESAVFRHPGNRKWFALDVYKRQALRRWEG